MGERPFWCFLAAECLRQVNECTVWLLHGARRCTLGADCLPSNIGELQTPLPEQPGCRSLAKGDGSPPQRPLREEPWHREGVLQVAKQAGACRRAVAATNEAAVSQRTGLVAEPSSPLAACLDAQWTCRRPRCQQLLPAHRATDQRIVFYAKKLGGYDVESFTFGNISSFEQSKSMMGHQISFFASGNKVTLKWISDLAAVEKFTHASNRELADGLLNQRHPTSQPIQQEVPRTQCLTKCASSAS